LGAISSVNGLIALDAVSNKIEIKMKAVMFLKSNKKRPIVIDCANVACQYAYNANNLGDGLGPVAAYKYWKEEGHEVKVFVMQRKLKNSKNPENVMANIEDFEREIPQKDRISIPVDGDDDSYFIRWAVKKGAILVSNDLLRDHRGRLKGEELEKFNSWIGNGRCGYIFVDDEFILDPNFQAIEPETVAVEVDLASTTKPPKPRRQRPTIPDDVIEEMRALSLSDKVLRGVELDSKIAELKGQRDESNSKWPEIMLERNTINQEVKEKTAKVKELKESRNQHNQATQKLKRERQKIDDELKAARRKGSVNEVRELEKKQDAAHMAVQREVSKAEKFHKQMVKISDVVNELRIKANEKHELKEKIKEESDVFHAEYIQVLHRKFRLMDLIKAEKKVQNQSEPQTEQDPRVKYHCPLCNQMFRSWSRALDHKRETGHGAYKCEECQTFLATKKNLTIHKRETGHTEISGVFFEQNEMSTRVKGQEVREEHEPPTPPFLSEVMGGKDEGDVAEELNSVLKEALVEYASKTKRRPHIVDRGELSYKLEEYTLQIISKKGWILGILNENRELITNTFLTKYDLGSFRLKIRRSQVGVANFLQEEAR